MFRKISLFSIFLSFLFISSTGLADDGFCAMLYPCKDGKVIEELAPKFLPDNTLNPCWDTYVVMCAKDHQKKDCALNEAALSDEILALTAKVQELEEKLESRKARKRKRGRSNRR